MIRNNSRLPVATCLVLAGSLGIAGLLNCSSSSRPQFGKANLDAQSFPIGSANTPFTSEVTPPRGATNSQLVPRGRIFTHVTSATNPSSSWESAMMARSTQLSRSTPTTSAEMATYSVQYPKVHQIIRGYLKQAGLDGDVTLPQNMTATDMRNIVKQAGTALEHREREARSAADQRRSDLAAAYPSPHEPPLTTTSHVYFDLPRPTLASVPFAYSHLGGLNTNGWHDAGVAARRDALQMYDNQMSGSMGWSGYTSDIDE